MIILQLYSEAFTLLVLVLVSETPLRCCVVVVAKQKIVVCSALGIILVSYDNAKLAFPIRYIKGSVSRDFRPPFFS